MEWEELQDVEEVARFALQHVPSFGRTYRGGRRTMERVMNCLSLGPFSSTERLHNVIELSRHSEELGFRLTFRSSLTSEVLDGVKFAFFFKNLCIILAGLGFIHHF